MSNENRSRVSPWVIAIAVISLLLGIVLFGSVGKENKSQTTSTSQEKDSSGLKIISGQIDYYYPNTSNCKLMSDIDGRVYDGNDSLLGNVFVDSSLSRQTGSDVVNGYVYHYCTVVFSTDPIRIKTGPLQIELDYPVTSSGARYFVIGESAWKSGYVKLSNR